MRQILLYEYITGGGLWGDASGQAPAGSLLAEGSAMIRALAADFAALPGVEVIVLRDCRLVKSQLPDCTCIEVGSAEEESAVLRRLATRADATILIAPEWAGELARRARLVLEAGGKLFSPGPEFIELAADKHRTAEYLRTRGVPAPRGIVLELGDALPLDFDYPAVLKPIDRAGSQGVRLIESAEARRMDLRSVHASVSRTGLVGPEVQPTDKTHLRLEEYCPGMPVSVAALIGPERNIILPACWQHFSSDGLFSYLGGKLPLPAELNTRAARLAEASLAVLPPTIGYVGFDLVLGTDPAGTQDVVIEINPRLTTSYVGLRALALGNLAAAWLDAAKGRRPELPFAAGPIEFRANGELTA